MLKAASIAFLAAALQTPAAALRPDPPIKCVACAAWNAPQDPFRIFGNTYYVGTAGLSALLIAGTSGLILLDGDLPQSAVEIDRHIRALGFRTADIRLILNSHPHYDHAGGIAALQRVTGARVVASAAGGRALQQGRPTRDDPQFGIAGNRFPAVRDVQAVADGEVVRLGDLAVTAHLTPGHTPGSTTWSWRSCEASRCLDVVYADSLTAVSADGFKFTGDATHPSLIGSFRRSIAIVDHLPCDIIVSVHPEFTDLKGKLERRAKNPRVNLFIDADGCHTYAAGALTTLNRRIASE